MATIIEQEQIVRKYTIVRWDETIHEEKIPLITKDNNNNNNNNNNKNEPIFKCMPALNKTNSIAETRYMN